MANTCEWAKWNCCKNSRNSSFRLNFRVWINPNEFISRKLYNIFFVLNVVFRYYELNKTECYIELLTVLWVVSEQWASCIFELHSFKQTKRMRNDFCIVCAVQYFISYILSEETKKKMEIHFLCAHYGYENSCFATVLQFCNFKIEQGSQIERDGGRKRAKGRNKEWKV